MAQFKMPDANRPPATVVGDNPTAKMASSGKAAESQKTSSLGASVTGQYDIARPGALTGQLPVDQDVSFVETAPGSGGNTAKSTPKISETNEIKQANGNMPGKQNAKEGNVASVHRPAPGVQNVWNENFGPKPSKARAK